MNAGRWAVVAAVLGLIASATLAAPPAPARRVPRKIKLTELDQRVSKLITALFLAYERRSVNGVMEHVGAGFRTRDAFGFAHSPAQMSSSLQADYQNLRSIQFDVDVEPPQYSADYRSARVEIHWQRRARFAVSGEEWIVRDQRSVLQFELDPVRTKLGAIEGEPSLGLSNAAGALIVDRGTIDGAPVTAPTTVKFGRLGRGAEDLTAFGNLRRVGRIAPPAAPAPAAPAAMPDLASTIVQVIDDPPSASGFSIRVQVRNQGTAAAGASVLMVNIDSPAVSRTAAVPGLAPGGMTDVTLAFDPPGPQPPPGPRTITSIADSTGAVAESNEGNNTNSILRVFTP